MIQCVFAERVLRFVFSRASITLAARNQPYVANADVLAVKKADENILFGVEARLEYGSLANRFGGSRRMGAGKRLRFVPARPPASPLCHREKRHGQDNAASQSDPSRHSCR